MNEQSTSELLHILNQTTPDNMEQYLMNHTGVPTIYEHFSAHMNQYNLKPADIVKNCQGYITKSYIYDLLNGKKCNPSRDNCILLCLACHMDNKATRRTMELFHHTPLYPKNNRDAIIAICINHNIYEIEQVNDKLSHYNEELLGAI